MARAHGKDANFAFGTATKLENEVNAVTLNFDVPVAEITAFSDTYQNVVAGKPAATIDIAGAWQSTATGGDAVIFAALGGAALNYDFEPDGTTGYDGYAVPTNYSITANTNDAIKYTATFQHNGKNAAIDGSAPSRA